MAVEIRIKVYTLPRKNGRSSKTAKIKMSIRLVKYSCIEKLVLQTSVLLLTHSCPSFHEHIQGKINKAYSTLGLIKLKTFIILYKSMVRPHIEYNTA